VNSNKNKKGDIILVVATTSISMLSSTKWNGIRELPLQDKQVLTLTQNLGAEALATEHLRLLGDSPSENAMRLQIVATVGDIKNGTACWNSKKLDPVTKSAIIAQIIRQSLYQIGLAATVHQWYNARVLMSLKQIEENESFLFSLS